MSVYGPLLKLSYVGDPGNNFLMRDLAKSDVYPLGWCQMNKVRDGRSMIQGF